MSKSYPIISNQSILPVVFAINNIKYFVTVSGNMSILPFYFGPGSPFLLTNSSLKAELELTTQGRIWEINIMGLLMKHCFL